MRHLLFRVLILTWTLAAVPAPAQTGIPFNQRDDQYVLLGLKRAKEMFEVARTEHERMQRLKEQGFASDAQVEAAHRTLADAEVNYQQSMLAVLFERQYVAVVGAVKHQAADGGKHVRLTLENTSGGGAEFQHLVGTDDALFRSLQPDVVHNVYVSLLNDDGAIIGQPYEAKVATLHHGQPVRLDFSLLQDLNAVTVNLLYGNGTSRAVKIFLQKDASEEKVLVQSEQFSQEAELGGSATYDLGLELFSGSLDTFRLEVVNLPASINRYFVDPSSDARLRQLRFTESARTRRAALRVFLPDRQSDDIPMDGSLDFFVLALPQNRDDELAALGEQDLDEQQIRELGVGYARLELVPRGVGRLLVRAPQLYHSAHPDETVAVQLEVVNEGTRRLDNIEVSADPPMGWEKLIEPALIPSLEVGEERLVDLHFKAADGTPVGKYEVRIQTTSFADEKPIQGEDKTLTVRLEPRASLAAPTILITLLVGTMTAVVGIGVRIARK